MRNKILLIEDDRALAETLKDFFEEDILTVYHALSGEEGLALYRERSPDLIVLDVMLPGMSGFEVIAAIRDTDRHIPIIMMTGTELDTPSQVRGYEQGALNYLPKPVLPPVLLAQIKHTLALLPAIAHYKIADLDIYTDVQHVDINGQIHPLREKDCQVFRLLLEHKEQTMQRNLILKQIWGDDAPSKNNLLDSSISRLRSFLEAYPKLQIATVYGGGYRLDERSVVELI